MYTLRIKRPAIINGYRKLEVFKEDGLKSDYLEDALEEIENLFNEKKFNGKEGFFFLTKHLENISDEKGKKIIIKEARLKIKSKDEWNWEIELRGNFVEVSK